MKGVWSQFIGRCLSAYTCCVIICVAIGVVFIPIGWCYCPKGKQQPHEVMHVNCSCYRSHVEVCGTSFSKLILTISRHTLVGLGLVGL